MQSLPQPTLPNIEMNNLTNNYQQPYRVQPNYVGNVNAPQQRPGYYQHSSNPGTMMGSPFVRRNSLSSVNSDQAGLTSHAQGQPWSSPYYGHNNNGSNTNLSYNIPRQQYQQPYNHNNNYPSQQQQQPRPLQQPQAYNNKPNYY